MFYKILLLLLFAAFISACSTTSQDASETSGSGTSGEFNTATTSEESSGISTDDESSVIPGSQEDLIVNVGDRVFFGYDSAELDQDAQELLQDQVAWIKEHNVSVTIEGHCDERGTREYNLALGERRANSVRRYLMALGVDANRINVISYGKERPAVLGSNPSSWAQNRRGVTVVD